MRYDTDLPAGIQKDEKGLYMHVDDGYIMRLNQLAFHCGLNIFNPGARIVVEDKNGNSFIHEWMGDSYTYTPIK